MNAEIDVRTRQPRQPSVGWTGGSTPAAAMALIAVLFLLRVIGQVLVTYADVAWLPGVTHWQSGLLPYPLLLASQVVILALMAAITRHTWRGWGWFVAPRPRFGRVLCWISVVYFLAMVVRYVMTMALHPDWLPFGHSIPTVFHCLLATYLFFYSGILTRENDQGSGVRPGSPDSACRRMPHREAVR